ncbi:hypothetical protein TD95_003302 [Thielaviopsis punctulata]|uniref:4-hydroxy-tetrahydrodipicolinate synthase n=1 Tax=Thielaviopsis punctulata TaxID=72032 RepID=A0A0F4ZCY9_9PEZI|nr:hypothetical protein TD95_003302 [Thielaviopsis punctulata]
MATSHGTPATLPDGVYVPTVTFFKNDEVDHIALRAHFHNLLTAGVTGLVVHGSNGEAAHLSSTEREEIIQTARNAINSHPRGPDVPLIAGCGAQSTRETISLCTGAAAAGATHALILPPSYYNSLTNDGALVAHFMAVADAVPIPLVLYNFPGAASGRDMSSDTILKIAQHSNVVGVKLTCGNTGKLARIAADAPKAFFTGGGSADFILQGHIVGGNGTISGLANICPRACLEVLRLAREEKYKEARELQAKLARADWVAIQSGFVGVKLGLNHLYGYNAEPRGPCVLPEAKLTQSIVSGFGEICGIEEALRKMPTKA